MNMLFVLIGIAIVLLALAVWAMFWAIRNGQFDDLESQGWSVVLDDDQKPHEPANKDSNDPALSDKDGP